MTKKKNSDERGLGDTTGLAWGNYLWCNGATDSGTVTNGRSIYTVEKYGSCPHDNIVDISRLASRCIAAFDISPARANFLIFPYVNLFPLINDKWYYLLIVPPQVSTYIYIYCT